MPAAVLERFGEPLALREVPVPVLAPGDALIEVRAVGLCATDLKVVSGALPTVNTPLIPGHEVAGVVIRAPGRAELEGARVACYLYESCGACRWCAEQRPTLCPEAVRIGMERDGGLARYVAVAQDNLLPFGAGLGFEAAAVAMDAVTTPWAALHTRGRVRPGQHVVVVGCGGLGANAVQIAVLAGARVAVVDPAASHRALGLDCGAEVVADPADLDVIRDWSADGADIALETSGVPAGFAAAAAVVRRGGRIVCNGYKPGADYGLDSARLVLEEIEISGSRLASREEATAALAAVESGAVRPRVMKRVPLEAVNEALTLLAQGGVEGRIVVSP